MDSIFAIAIGLGIRILVDVVSQHDFRVGGSLVGLWEGVVLYHFLDKMPKSFDPYVAYGFRLFVDFLFTESLYRMALVLLWTALGMVLSDIAPVFWYDIGLRHVYRRLRRDVELFGLPTLPFFSKTSTSSRVRFRSPSRASSVVTSVRSIATSSSSSTLTPTNVTPRSTPVTLPAVMTTRRKSRRVPGSFPDDWSETDADSNLPPSEPSEDGSQPLHDLHPIPEIDESSAESDIDPDQSTETPDDDDLLSEESSDSVDPSAKDPLEIPEEDEQFIHNQKYDQDRTPTAHHIPLPPTPAESDIGVQEVHEVQPPLSEVPLIPDSPFVPDTFDAAGGEDTSTPLPIPPVIHKDFWPPAYNEPLTGTKTGPTPSPNETIPNDTTENEPPPIINVQPPVPDKDVTDNDPPPAFESFDSHSQPPSQNDKQPNLGSGPSPAEFERPESALSENTSTRLEQALTYRREAAKIQKRILVVEEERRKALEDKKSEIALRKSQEKEALEKEEKEVSRKAENFNAHNASSMADKISVANLEPDEAVSRIEAALASQAQSKTELRVTFGNKKANKTIASKDKIRAVMKEHQILVHDGPNSNDLIITLPKFDE